MMRCNDAIQNKNVQCFRRCRENEPGNLIIVMNSDEDEIKEDRQKCEGNVRYSGMLDPRYLDGIWPKL
jgi:hypothetical protein